MADLKGDIPTILDTLAAEINKLQADVAALRTAYNTHQHAALNAVPSVGIVGALTSVALTHHGR